MRPLQKDWDLQLIKWPLDAVSKSGNLHYATVTVGKTVFGDQWMTNNYVHWSYNFVAFEVVT